MDPYLNRKRSKLYQLLWGSSNLKMQDRIFQKSFHYASLKVLNDTPSTIHDLPTTNAFKGLDSF